MSAMIELGDCPGCGCPANRHVGGGCYGLPDYVMTPLGAMQTALDWHWCGWRYLGAGNVWEVPEGWWHWRDLPEGKSRTILPEQIEFMAEP